MIPHKPRPRARPAATRIAPAAQTTFAGGPQAAAKAGRTTATLHPRNRHQGRYDFSRLVAAYPPLASFIVRNPDAEPSIPFADPRAVRALNRALLADQYQVTNWDIPDGFLCPPVPGRADYLHHVADLLAADGDGMIPRGSAVRVLDIGVGANCIYPLVGHREYGWRFVGTDINPLALEAAAAIVEANPDLRATIELRRQPRPDRILRGVIGADERFDLSICNPPFHDSPEAALEGTRRKWRNLGRREGQCASPTKAALLNFGGHGAELWCPGGEAGFVGGMIRESHELADRCLWFTTLVSKAENLPGVRRALAQAGAVEQRVLAMGQGQKQSRVVAWTFLDGAARLAWARARPRQEPPAGR